MKLRTIADKRAAVASGVAIALFALGCASTPPESPEQSEADAAIARQVYEALQADRMHLYIGLNVRVHAGVVNINGLTFDPSVRDAATEIASSVPGVTKVVNQIDVQAGSGP